jgi:hypothetical protein
MAQLKLDIYIKQRPLRTYLFRYLVIRAAMGTEGGENKGKPSYYNLPPDIGFTLFTVLYYPEYSSRSWHPILAP